MGWSWPRRRTVSLPAPGEGRGAAKHMLERSSAVKDADDKHGATGARRLRYVPTYMLRGLQMLLDFDPLD